MAPSLIDTVRSIFLQAIRSVDGWKILVIDQHAQKLLSSVLKHFDILEEKVTLVESISSRREPQQFHAVYMLMSTTHNVEGIINDFSHERKQYSGAHLFFLDALPDSLVRRLASSPAEPHLKCLKELFVNFWANEAQSFSMNAPELFFTIYGPPRESSFKRARSELEMELQFIANLCIVLNEFPYIRYYLPSHHPPLGPLQPNLQTRAPPPPEGSSRWRTNLARGEAARQYETADTEYVSKLLAHMVHNTLEQHKKNNPDFPKPSDPPRPRGTLIITDRAMDVVAPFLHEFTYQAMCHDLLKIDGTKYRYTYKTAQGKSEEKEATLTDGDDVWTAIRHMHMQDAISKLKGDFDKFLQDHAGFKSQGDVSLNDMKDMLASLPQYREQGDKFSLHLNMADACMGMFQGDNLSSLANVEQCCATGLNAQGKTPKTLVEEMVPLLDNDKVSPQDKIRIIALYVMYRDGVPEEDRRRLYQHARLGPLQQDTINALVHLGSRVTRGPSDKDTKKKLKQSPATGDEYELSRFKPLLRTVIEDHVSSKLDQTLFPYVKDAPSSITHANSHRQAPTPTTSLRSAKPSWHKAVRSTAPVDNRQRVIVFVAGGMTYSEVREAYSLGASLNKDVYIGSTHMMTPLGFVNDLKTLEMCGVGSCAAGDGVFKGALPDSYQEFYDQKYPSPPLPQKPSGTKQPVPTHSAKTKSDSPASSVAPQEKGNNNMSKMRKLFKFS